MTIRDGYEAMNQAVKYFYKAMNSDMYPTEQSEGIFGVQMVPNKEQHGDKTRVSIGNLVFLVWVPLYQALYRQHDALRHEMVMMILRGKFPEWFEDQVKKFANSTFGKRVLYVQDLLERGFDNIKYDILLLRYRWGEISDADMDTLPYAPPVRWFPDPTAGFPDF